MGNENKQGSATSWPSWRKSRGGEVESPHNGAGPQGGSDPLEQAGSAENGNFGGAKSMNDKDENPKTLQGAMQRFADPDVALKFVMACYVKGEVHTNGLENFWCLLKRSFRGTHVSVEPFHLFRYLDEEAFRFNNRQDKDGNRFVKAVGGIERGHLTYRQLTNGAPDPN